jgi:hypothetical protein
MQYLAAFSIEMRTTPRALQRRRGRLLLAKAVSKTLADDPL